LVIPYRAVIPDGNAVGAAESPSSFNAMQSPAQLVAFDTAGALTSFVGFPGLLQMTLAIPIHN
jgi:hypothetical protein